MSDLESFFGLDQADAQASAEAFEAFKERMRENAKHIKALQKSEAKQKKKEDKLAKIISYFLKKHAKGDILLLVSRLIEQNVPASVILSLILLGNEDIQEKSGIKLELPPGMSEEKFTEKYKGGSENKKLTIFGQKSVLPLKVKISIDLWGKSIYEAGKSAPYKVLQTILDFEENLKPIVIQTSSKILYDFLKQNDIDADQKSTYEFSEFMLKGIVDKIKKETKKKALEEGEEV